MIAKTLTTIALFVVWFIVGLLLWSQIFPISWVISIDNSLTQLGINIYNEYGDERIYDFAIDLCIVGSLLFSVILTIISRRMINRYR